MTIVQHRDYWIESPGYGTFQATCELVSTNGKSLAFTLYQEICVGTGTGMAVSALVPLAMRDGEYHHVIDDSVWTIYEEEPAEKIATQ